MAHIIVPATSVRKKRLAATKRDKTDDAAVRAEMVAAVMRMIERAIEQNPDCPRHASNWVDQLNQCRESLQDPS